MKTEEINACFGQLNSKQQKHRQRQRGSTEWMLKYLFWLDILMFQHKLDFR